MLPSQVNTPQMRAKVETAARKYFHKRKGLSVFFEHGHYWCRVQDETEEENGERTYDVVDAEGGDAVNGFSFEEI